MNKCGVIYDSTLRIVQGSVMATAVIFICWYWCVNLGCPDDEMLSFYSLKPS